MCYSKASSYKLRLFYRNNSTLYCNFNGNNKLAKAINLPTTIILSNSGKKKTKAQKLSKIEITTMKANKNIAHAYFAAGCFWGVEHLMRQQTGVLDAISGYMGGHIANPSYEQVCQKNTGHLEVVQVTYSPATISFEALTKFFFEIHDPEQSNGQGPDIGPQYLSAIFYNNETEKVIAEQLIEQLKTKGLRITTQLLTLQKFWPAETYHQHYYEKTGKTPYCHHYTKRF